MNIYHLVILQSCLKQSRIWDMKRKCRYGKVTYTGDINLCARANMFLGQQRVC